jgi:sulfite reductase beta subunit-like hemoprotein
MEMQRRQLPSTAQEIAEVIGVEKTMELVRGKQKTKCRSLYVPSPNRMKSSHWLVQTIGEEAARELSQEYAGEPLTIPKCSCVIKLERNKRIVQMRQQGFRYQDIADTLGMNVSTVKMVFSRWMHAHRHNGITCNSNTGMA